MKKDCGLSTLNVKMIVKKCGASKGRSGKQQTYKHFIYSIYLYLLDFGDDSFDDFNCECLNDERDLSCARSVVFTLISSLPGQNMKNGIFLFS